MHIVFISTPARARGPSCSVEIGNENSKPTSELFVRGLVKGHGVNSQINGNAPRMVRNVGARAYGRMLEPNGEHSSGWSSVDMPVQVGMVMEDLLENACQAGHRLVHSVHRALHAINLPGDESHSGSGGAVCDRWTAEQGYQEGV